MVRWTKDALLRIEGGAGLGLASPLLGCSVRKSASVFCVWVEPQNSTKNTPVCNPRLGIFHAENSVLLFSIKGKFYAENPFLGLKMFYEMEACFLCCCSVLLYFSMNMIGSELETVFYRVVHLTVRFTFKLDILPTFKFHFFWGTLWKVIPQEVKITNGREIFWLCMCGGVCKPCGLEHVFHPIVCLWKYLQFFVVWTFVWAFKWVGYVWSNCCICQKLVTLILLLVIVKGHYILTRLTPTYA